MKQNCGKSSLFYILLRRHILLDIESFLFLYLYRFGGGFYYILTCTWLYFIICSSSFDQNIQCDHLLQLLVGLPEPPIFEIFGSSSRLFRLLLLLLLLLLLVLLLLVVVFLTLGSRQNKIFSVEQDQEPEPDQKNSSGSGNPGFSTLVHSLIKILIIIVLNFTAHTDISLFGYIFSVS